jgi:hypothetical protein
MFEYYSRKMKEGKDKIDEKLFSELDEELLKIFNVNYR